MKHRPPEKAVIIYRPRRKNSSKPGAKTGRRALSTEWVSRRRAPHENVYIRITHGTSLPSLTLDGRTCMDAEDIRS
jgi:hypothetical protein